MRPFHSSRIIQIMGTRIHADSSAMIRGYPRTTPRSSACFYLRLSARSIGGNPRHGQTALEYGVLIAIVVAALLTMQVYVKRGLSGKVRQAADSIGEQYAPNETTSQSTLKVHTDTTTDSALHKDQVIGPGSQKADVVVMTTTLNASTTDRTGSETVGPLKKDVWQ